MEGEEVDVNKIDRQWRIDVTIMQVTKIWKFQRFDFRKRVFWPPGFKTLKIFLKILLAPPGNDNFVLNAQS